MQIQKLPPAQIPNGLDALLKSHRSVATTSNGTPGILLGLDQVARIQPLAQSSPQLTPQNSGLVIIPPKDCEAVFTDAQLGLIKAVTKALAERIDCSAKMIVDGLWLVFDAKTLFAELSDPNHDKTLALFKFAGLSLGSAKIIDAAFPGFSIPEALSTGLDFLATSGEATYLGKQIPINEFLLAQNKWAEIPIQALKCGGIAIDYQTPSFQTLTIQPLPPKQTLPSLRTLHSTSATPPA